MPHARPVKRGRAGKNEARKMHGDDPCIHPVTAELEIFKLWGLFSQPLVSAVRIKVGLLGIHSIYSHGSLIG